MSHKVYVLGSINYDLMISADRLPKQGETLNGYNYLESIGGKGNNQANASAKMGAETYLIASVGNDIHGKLSIDNLLKSGVNTNYVMKNSDSSTGVAFVISIERDNRILINSGANSLIESRDVERALSSSSPGDFFLAQFETPREIVFDALKNAKNKGLTTILNPAPAYAIDRTELEMIDYLVVNQSESEILTNIYPTNESEYKKVFKFLLNKGLKNLIITLGDKGCVYINEIDFIYEKSHKIDVVDTTGAGDTFIGALVYGMSRDWEMKTSLKKANVAGALACTQLGAVAGMPSIEEVNSFIENTKIMKKS